MAVQQHCLRRLPGPSSCIAQSAETCDGGIQGSTSASMFFTGHISIQVLHQFEPDYKKLGKKAVFIHYSFVNVGKFTQWDDIIKKHQSHLRLWKMWVKWGLYCVLGSLIWCLCLLPVFTCMCLMFVYSGTSHSISDLLSLDGPFKYTKLTSTLYIVECYNTQNENT